MRIDSYAGSRGDVEAVPSPFAGLSYLEANIPGQERSPTESDESPLEGLYTTESRFGGDVYSEADASADEATDLLESLHDEDFKGGVARLMPLAHVLPASVRPLLSVVRP
jgi:hypothetical protein